MRIFVDPTRKKVVQPRVAALVLLAVALMIPQLTWADHASDHPYSQFDDQALISLSEGSAALVEKYKSGELVFHTPGRPDDRSFSASADSVQIDAAFLAANPETMVLRRLVASQQGIAAAASLARWVALGEYYADRGATFLTANPEVRTYRRFVQDGCSEASQVC